RREGYSLLSTPKVLMEEDEDLQMGEFGIATRLVQAPKEQGEAKLEAPPEPVMGGTKVFSPPPSATAAVSAEEAQELGLAHESRARLNVDGKPYELSRDVVVLGRSRENGNWFVVDLGSTNGIEVNGKRTDRAKLEHDDRILLGRTEVTFERS